MNKKHYTSPEVGFVDFMDEEVLAASSGSAVGKDDDDDVVKLPFIPAMRE